MENKTIVRAFLIGVVLATTVIHAVSQHQQDKLPELLKAAYAARSQLKEEVSKTSLTQFDETLFRHNPVARMIYAAHIYKISNGNQILPLMALPKTATEMEAFYEFTHSKDANEFLPYYLEFYTSAFALASEHPDYLDKLFDVATEYDTRLYPNYDDYDFFLL